MAFKGLWLRSGTGYASTPDAAALDITGNIGLRGEVVHKSWRPTIRSSVVSKWVSGTNQSYVLSVEQTGELRLTVSTTGADSISYNSTVPVPETTAPTRLAIRADRNSSTGNTTFYTAPTMGGTWVQLGAVVAGTAGAIFSGTAIVTIGNIETTGNQWIEAVILAVQIYNDVTIALNVDFAVALRGATSFVCATGQTITKNGTAYFAKETYYLKLIVLEGLEIAKNYPTAVHDDNMDLIDPLEDDIDIIEPGWTFITSGSIPGTTNSFSIDATAGGKWPPGSFELLRLHLLSHGNNTGHIFCKLNTAGPGDYRWGSIAVDSATGNVVISGAGHAANTNQWVLGRTANAILSITNAVMFDIGRAVLSSYQSSCARIHSGASAFYFDSWGALDTSLDSPVASLEIIAEVGDFTLANWLLEGFRVPV